MSEHQARILNSQWYKGGETFTRYDIASYLSNRKVGGENVYISITSERAGQILAALVDKGSLDKVAGGYRRRSTARSAAAGSWRTLSNRECTGRDRMLGQCGEQW